MLAFRTFCQALFCAVLLLQAACAAGSPPETSGPSPSGLSSASSQPDSSGPDRISSCSELPKLSPERIPGSDIQIDLWPWGAQAAVSLTIDEGLNEPYTILMPEIELRGWRASFYIYTDQPTLENTWNRVILAHQRGHEISNHTKTHPNLTTLSDARIHEELKGGNQDLLAKLGELPLQSFAYPYEATDARVSAITLQYHRYARAGDHGAPTPPYPINDAHKPDFGALKAKAPTREISLTDWNKWIDATLESRGWFIEELHGVEDIGASGGWEPRTIDDFRRHFDHIESFQGKIWVAPIQNVGNYIEERESASISLQAWHAQGIQFSLKDAFEKPELSEPLTLLIKLPAGWQGREVKASQAGKNLQIKTVGQGQLRLAALPNQQPVCLLAN